MKSVIAILLVCLTHQITLAQSLAEKAYQQIVKAGPSTGPGLVVVTIINAHTNQSQEMCLTVNELFDCLKIELKEDDYKKIKKDLLTNYPDRIIKLQDTASLNFLNFDRHNSKKALRPKHKITDETTINKIVITNHLVDSLSKIDTLRQRKSKLFDKYWELRSQLLKQISDSIALIRPLMSKEKQVLRDLKDPFYDFDESLCGTLRGDSKEDENIRKQTIRIWDSKLSLYKNYKEKYSGLNNELSRCEKKFFRNYYNRYGLAFCKVVFKYGVMCYFGDENPQVEFGEVIK